MISQKLTRAPGRLADRRSGEDGIPGEATVGRRANGLAPRRRPLRSFQAALRALGLIAGLTLLLAAPARAREEPVDPLEEVALFEAAGAAGTLLLPAGAPDRRTPAVVILRDALGPDGRAALYVEQLLGADLAVLELVVAEDVNLGDVLEALAAHPRILAGHLGLLGFGAEARQVAEWPGRVRSRALLYPGCASLSPAAMPDEAVLVMHDEADALHASAPCGQLAAQLSATARQLQWLSLAGAGHARDRPGSGGEGRSMLPAPHGPSRIAAVHHPGLAALSAAQVAGFFATSLLAPAR